MIKNKLPLICAITCAFMILSCSKDEQTKPNTKRTDPVAVVTGPVINPSFAEIDTVSAWYLTATKIDFSKTGKSTLKSIKNDTISLNFDCNMAKNERWGTIWGSSPFVECPSPQVLYSPGRSVVYIDLSKRVTLFGFELALNKFTSAEIQVTYWDITRQAWVGQIKRRVVTNTNHADSTTGARMLAVHSDVPFNRLQIAYTTFVGAQKQPDPNGYAFANFRYVLAK